MTRRGKREPVPVGQVLEGALGTARYRQLQQQMALHAAWEEMAGPVLAKHVRLVALQDGVLWLEADSPPFAQEAQLHSLRLMEAISLLLGQEACREVRVGKGRPSSR